MTSNMSVLAKAKDYYFNQWRGKENIRPAFGEKVFVTRLGWNHLVHHKRHKTKDVMMRLKCLPWARQILETSTYYQDYRKVGNLYYYGFDAYIEGKKIRVVVSARGKSGKKVLLSVIYRK